MFAPHVEFWPVLKRRVPIGFLSTHKDLMIFWDIAEGKIAGSAAEVSALEL
jgi:hypothetical protein